MIPRPYIGMIVQHDGHRATVTRLRHGRMSDGLLLDVRYLSGGWLGLVTTVRPEALSLPEAETAAAKTGTVVATFERGYCHERKGPEVTVREEVR